MKTDSEKFLSAYIATALWSSTDYPFGECPCCGKTALLDHYPEKEYEQQLMCSAEGCGVTRAEDDIDPATKEEMRADCEQFLSENRATIDAAIATGEVKCGPDFDEIERAGHDFWLTRCGHGCGFWDGDWPEPHAEQLTEAAESFGNVDLYVGDDGKIYQN